MKLSQKIFILLSFTLFVSFVENVKDANYWTRFRGLNGSGIGTQLSVPAVWDSIDFKWIAELPGSGNASPVVWDNMIFITSSDNQKDIGYALAVNAKDGSILWQKEFIVTDLTMHVDNNLAAPTPAVDDSQVYFVWYSKEKTNLIALSHEGSFRWEAEFDGIQSRHGGGSSLMLTDNYVVFTREQEDFSTLKSSWIAVDKGTGETVWEMERESAEANSFGTPLLLEKDNSPNQLIFASQAHGITGVDVESGEVLWERKDVLPARVVASPIYSEGFMVACRKGGAIVMEMPLGASQPADTVLYALPRNLSPYVPTPIIVGEFLYLFTDNGTVACLRLSTGELLWKERPAGAIYGSPVFVDGKLFCITKEGEVIVVRADDKYELLGINSLGEGSFSTPVMAETGMVFRTFTHLMML